MKFALSKITSSVCLGLLFSTSLGFAQSVIPDGAIILNGTAAGEVILNESAPTELSYKSTYGLSPFTVVDEKDKSTYTIIPTDEQTIQNRMRGLQNIMPLTYNSTVRQFIDFFMIRRPSFTRTMLEKKDYYFPTFEKYLAKYDMPDELKYLALIESGLNPKAVSRASAVGLWQFMSFTGREQGLYIDEYIDERMHVEKSTDAACRYLRTLYRMFDNWDLALAAYNSGPGTIRRALRRSGRTDYWDIHSFIPKDTRTYVPQFIAINYMMNYGPSHGITPVNVQYPIDSRPFVVNGFIDLKKFAELSLIDYAVIQQLNPHIKKDILPSYTRNFELNIPSYQIDYVYANSYTILEEASKQAYQTQPTLADNGVILNSPTSAPILNSITPTNVITDIEPSSNTVVYNNNTSTFEEERPVRPTTTVKKVKKFHKVRRGENLNTIANRYDVSVSELRKWNHLRSSKILVGQKIAYYTTVKTSNSYSSNSVATNKSVNARNTSKVKKPIYYTVKPGDTLWSISQRNGTTVSDIKRLNKIHGNTVKVGQKLKITS